MNISQKQFFVLVSKLDKILSFLEENPRKNLSQKDKLDRFYKMYPTSKEIEKEREKNEENPRQTRIM